MHCGVGLRAACLCAALLLVGVCDTVEVAAQAASSEQQITFARMENAPLDYEATFAYVRASVDNRDYEGAISALERLLTYNPHLSRAKYELGSLYFRQQSYAMAQMYFEDALSDPSLDPAISKRIANFLPEAKKLQDKSQFSGIFQLGYRYNSNIAGVPGSNLIRAFGLDLPSVRAYRNQSDSAIFGLTEIGHIYDFQNQRGDVWESKLSAYGARQFQLTTLSVGLADFSTGPRLALAPDFLPGWTIRPYFAIGGSLIYDRRYSGSYGGGVTLGAPVTPFFTLEVGFEGRRVSILPIENLPNQGVLSSGALWMGTLGGRWSVSDKLSFNARAFLGRNAADSGGVSSNQSGLEGSMKFDFVAPFETIGAYWSVTPFVRYLMANFDRPDVTVDPFIARRDRQIRAGLQVDMPITALFGVNASAQYARNDSNIANYRADSWSFLLGPTIRF